VNGFHFFVVFFLFVFFGPLFVFGFLFVFFVHHHGQLFSFFLKVFEAVFVCSQDDNSLSIFFGGGGFEPVKFLEGFKQVFVFFLLFVLYLLLP
jgi:hypothetical protein